MKNILITGASGNVGSKVIKYLFEMYSKNRIIAGVRNINKAKVEFKVYSGLQFVEFDFENPATFENSLKQIDCIFLLRPPHISDVQKYFSPLIKSIIENKINQVVFLSVQGAEKSKIIPHNKIENMIKNSALNYVFLRPSYFMQNLTTTLRKDIIEKQNIILPSANAKFNWIDIENISEIAAKVLIDFDKFQNTEFDITGYENLNFPEVVNLINKELNTNIKFKNVSLPNFYRIKRKEGLSSGLIIVMALLHFLPRLQSEPTISDFYERITGKKPTLLKDFILREKSIFSVEKTV